MGVNWLISLCASLTILALWAFCRKTQRSWVSPGGMLCAVWFFGTMLPLFFAGDFPAFASAYLLVLGFVAVGVIFTSLPMAVLTTPTAPGAPRIFQWPEERALLKRIYGLSLAVGALTPIAVYIAAVSQFGTTDFLELAVKVTVARYSGDFQQPIYISILTMFLFFASLLGGLLLGLSQEKLKKSLPFLAWILPLLAASMIQTTKATFLFGAVLFGGAFVTGIVSRGGEQSVRIGRLLLFLTTVCVLGFAFVYVGLLARYSASGDAAESSVPKATVYFVGHMGAIGDWMESGGIGRSACAGGSYTFGGLFEFAGLHARDQGLYDEMITFPGGATTNIYTVFRSMIDDFTLPGALVFFAALSFIAGFGWVGMLEGNRVAAFPLTAYLAFVFLSPITSVFVYNSNVGALGLFGMLVIVTGWLPLSSRARFRRVQNAV